MTPAPRRPQKGSGGRGRPPGAGSGGRRPGQGSGQGRPDRRSGPGPNTLGGDQIEGRRAVLALLEARARPVQRVAMAAELDPSEQLDRIEAICRRDHVPLEVMPKARLERVALTESHQGVIARARSLKPVPIEELLVPELRVQPFLLVCDGLTDPHNLGSLLRSAEGAGVTGVILPRHRSVRISPTVAKVAAGAIEHLRVCLVPGIPAALEQLGKAGIETVGLAGEAKRSLWATPLTDLPVALVIGSEEKGLAPLTRKRCSALASIPQIGSIESLNASVAGGIALFEVARQRTMG